VVLVTSLVLFSGLVVALSLEGWICKSAAGAWAIWLRRAFGVVVSVPLGHVATYYFGNWMHGVVAKDTPRTWWIPAVMGCIERLVVLLIVAATSDLTPVLTVVAGWILVKQAVGWQRGEVKTIGTSVVVEDAGPPKKTTTTTTTAPDENDLKRVRSLAFVGLWGSVASFAFAYIGGLISVGITGWGCH
jgi:hypothetical protein